MEIGLNLETLLAAISIIGTIATLYFGIKFREHKNKKVDITFLKNHSVSLFNPEVKNQGDFKVIFKSKQIEENLILFQGTFFNNGNVDIDKLIIHTPLKLILPKNYFLFHYNLLDKSEEFSINLTDFENQIIFNWDLFKVGEYFTFECLIEYKKQDKETNKKDDINSRLLREIKTKHRITELKDIEMVDSIPDNLEVVNTLIFTTLLLVLFFGYFSFGQLIFPKYYTFYQLSLPSGAKDFMFEAYNDSTISIIGVNGEVIKNTSINNADVLLKKSNFNIIKKVVVKWRLYVFGAASIIYAILFVLFIYWSVIEGKKGKRIEALNRKINRLNHKLQS